MNSLNSNASTLFDFFITVQFCANTNTFRDCPNWVVMIFHRCSHNHLHSIQKCTAYIFYDWSISSECEIMSMRPNDCRHWWDNISIYSLMLFLSNNVWILVQLQLKGQKKNLPHFKKVHSQICIKRIKIFSFPFIYSRCICQICIFNVHFVSLSFCSNTYPFCLLAAYECLRCHISSTNCVDCPARHHCSIRYCFCADYIYWLTRADWDRLTHPTQ